MEGKNHAHGKYIRTLYFYSLKFTWYQDKRYIILSTPYRYMTLLAPILHLAHIKIINSPVIKILGRKYTKPGLQAEKNRAHHKYKKNYYSDDGLPSSWIQYNQMVRHRYILFVLMVSSVFSAFPA